jgi:hypothetical protein
VKAIPPGTNNSAAYFNIENHSDEDIAITQVSSDGARITEFHQHVMEQGLMKMNKLDSLNIPANSRVELKPGHYHLMLIQLKQPIRPGDKIKITLGLSSGESFTITATVKANQ